MEKKIKIYWEKLELKIIIFLLTLILTAHLLGIYYLWYFKYFWLDILMHFLGGFWLAMFFLYLKPKVFVEKLSHWPNVFLNLVLVLSFVALIGVFWEFFEFGFDVFIVKKLLLAKAQNSLADTMGDLFFNFLGATVFFFLKKIFIS